jgi:ribosomal protein S18 acetylase RimI-like enzyme
MKITCKSARIKDTETILGCMKDFYELEGIKFNRGKSKEAIENLIRNKSIGILWMILANNTSIGYCCIAFSYTLENYGRDCFLDELYIKPEYRSKGIGSMVMKLIEDYMVRLELKAIHLYVNNTNTDAYKYYIKHGFHKHEASYMTRIIGGSV